MEMNELLKVVVDRNASDIHLVVGKPPVLRIDGRLDVLDFEELTNENTEKLMKSITSEHHQQKLQEIGGTDFGFSFGDIARFRVAIYKERGNTSIAMRLIPMKLLTFEELGLAEQIKQLMYKQRGLILVTGPTGCGKTTTLATMIDYIARNRDAHIITVEDPIEYYHTHHNGVMSQRELGVDVPSFSEALVRALRQDPDIIMVGEMRDLATMESAISAAETGHLVFATLHTTGAAATIDRIVDAFPTAQQEQIRTQLSESLVAVISQQLIPRTTGGRVASYEIMVATSAIRNLVREKKSYRILSSIQTGKKLGMKTMDDSLTKLYNSKIISYEEYITRCYNVADAEKNAEEGKEDA